MLTCSVAEPGIIYSLIARGTIVMVEHSSREGNFVTLAKVTEKGEKKGRRSTSSIVLVRF